MTDTQTIEAINAHLDDNPTDWTARLELADLYEEAGRDDEARYQRWAVKYERAPSIWEGRHFPEQHPWHWWVEGGRRDGASDGIGQLARMKLNSFHRGYVTRQEAEADLMRVLIAQAWPAPTRG